MSFEIYFLMYWYLKACPLFPPRYFIGEKKCKDFGHCPRISESPDAGSELQSYMQS